MNPALRAGYEGAALLARALSGIAPHAGNKIVESFAQRRGALARYSAFARERANPLVWMHAPSVGEGLQARPVLELLRERRPRVQRAYTYFSPSARSFAEGLDVDFRDILPFDDTLGMRAAIRALDPTVLVFSKADVWPTLAREASAKGVKLALISATLAHGSSRRGTLAKALLRDAYGRLDRVGAISVEDADRLVSLGVPVSRVTVTGDTRYDQVWARTKVSDRAGTLLDPLRSLRPTLVAGSTWPADEAILLEAWAALCSRSGDARLIVAPHEPTAAHVASVEQWARDAGLAVLRLSAAGGTEADVIIVDRVGILGDLYALADVAYVGGGFHDAGLHSVLEPAAFGVPVLFGPRHTNSRDARLLLDDDAAQSVEGSGELTDQLERWLLKDRIARGQAGEAAMAVVRRGLGASERTFALIDELMR